MLISYSSKRGIATITWLIKSGGVITAASINTTTIECFLYFFKNSGVIIPIFANMYATTGSKNIKPV